MTSAQIVLLGIDIVSVLVLCTGLFLHRNLTMDRRAFQSALHVDATVSGRRTMGVLAWSYVVMTILLLLLSMLPFFGWISLRP